MIKFLVTLMSMIIVMCLTLLFISILLMTIAVFDAVLDFNAKEYICEKFPRIKGLGKKIFNGFDKIDKKCIEKERKTGRE